MEDPPKHHNTKKIKNKNKNKNFPVTINIGAGAGIGGIVLVGGALVTATIVSLLAFRLQRRSSPANIKKNRSPAPSPSLSPETKTVEASNELELELMMKSNTDFSSPFDLHNSSSDEVVSNSMKEMKTKNIEILTLTQEEKGNSGIHNDEKVESGDIIFSVVGEDEDEDEENTSNYDSREVDCEEQVVIAVDQPKRSSTMNCDEHVDDEVVTLVEEECEAIEGVDHVPFEDDVTKSSEQEIEEATCVNQVEQVKETVFVNEQVVLENCEGDLIDETGGIEDEIVSELVMEKEEEEVIEEDCVNQIEVQNDSRVQFLEEEKHNDCKDEIVLENCDETDHVNQIMKEENQQMQNGSEQVTQKEAIKADCFNHMEDILKIIDHEVVLDAKKLNLNENPSSAAAVDDQTVPPTQLMNKEEKSEETVDMITENELVKKDEIPHVELIKVEDEDVTVKNEVISDEFQDDVMQENIDNHKIEEKMEEYPTTLGKEQKNDINRNNNSKKRALVSDPWNLKLLTWTVFVLTWCLCHWYFELPYPEVSFVGSLLFVLILLGYQNRSTTTYLVKYE